MSGIVEELNGRNREIVEKYETVKIWINKKCGKVIAEPKELIGIQKKHQSYGYFHYVFIMARRD
jgi:hypothetical protein